MSEPAADAAPARTAPAARRAAPLVWLNGTVLSCACPECRGPMSIRAWLMIGDCASCGTSVELSFEQEQEVRRLLAERAEPAAAAPAASTPTAPATSAPVSKLPAAAPTRAKPAPPPAPAAPVIPQRAAPPVAPARVPAAASPRGAARRAYELAAHGRAKVLRRNLLRDLPAWLASMIIHLVLMLILGMLHFHDAKGRDAIVLSSVVGSKHQEGEPAVHDPIKNDVEIETPGKPPEPQEPPAVVAAKHDAQELQEPLTAPAVHRPPVERVMTALATPTRERMFEGRDPRIRSSVVNSEGGTTYTEAAVARGLRWLDKHQSEDGSWSLSQFHRAGDCDGRCDRPGQPSDTAGTALALLPFLGAGQTHLHGRYTRTVAKGLRYLLDEQREDGDLRGRGVGQMYAHGQCAIVLCEAYALTGDDQLRDAAERAVRFIVAAQHRDGGWRYRPGEPGDTSVVGWQLMALRSARMALLEVPERTFSRAAQFLDQVSADELGSFYSYQPGSGPSPAMTAEALLCRQYLGWPADQPGLRRGARWLVEEHPPRRDQANIYYWYYATQVLHHLGGSDWQSWNQALRDTLVAMQETAGHAAGSWTPRGGAIGGHDVQVGGRLYMTSLAICTLEVYYRHLPIYRPVEISSK